MTGPTAVITTNGLSKISYALAHGTTVDVSYFKIGSSIITPSASMTDVTGLVYTGLTSQLTLSVLTTSQVDFQVSLYATVGPFTVGNIGLFCTDGTMFAILALDLVQAKTSTVTTTPGNILVYSSVLSETGLGTVINLSITGRNVTRLVGIQNTDSNLTFTGSPIVSAGNIQITLANNINIVNDVHVGHDLTVSGDLSSGGSITISDTLDNKFIAAGSTTSNPVTLTSSGIDSDISVNIVPKGRGNLLVKGSPVVSLNTVKMGSGTVSPPNLWATRTFTLTRVSDVFVLFSGDWRTGQSTNYAQLYLDGVSVTSAWTTQMSPAADDQAYSTGVIQTVLSSVSIGTHTISVYYVTPDGQAYFDRGSITVIPVGTL